MKPLRIFNEQRSSQFVLTVMSVPDALASWVSGPEALVRSAGRGSIATPDPPAPPRPENDPSLPDTAEPRRPAR